MHKTRKLYYKHWSLLLFLMFFSVTILTSCGSPPSTPVPDSKDVIVIPAVPAALSETPKPSPPAPATQTPPAPPVAELVTQTPSEAAPNSEAPSAPEPAPQTPSEPATGPLKVHFLDVGQGDAIFIELPNQQTMLIDAGNAGNGTEILSYIRKAGYERLDYVVASHPHADHIGGMATVVKSMPVGTFYMPKKEATTKTFENLLSTIQDEGLSIHTAKAGVSILSLDSLKVDIVAPVGSSYSDLNDYSAIIKLTYGANAFLFTGDAETASQSQITADIRADVLKVGHHGSDESTSEGFLRAVAPAHAVISVGKSNQYKHPTDSTLAILAEKKIATYRTDMTGTIVFTSDGKTLTSNKKEVAYQPQAPPVATTPKPSPPVAAVPAPPKPTPAPAPTPPPAPKPAPAEPVGTVVYVTKTGEKYHSDGCRYLSKSKIEITLKDAKSRGFDPCSVCNPPQ